MKSPEERAKELLASMTRSELVDLLEESGVEVMENGSGNVIFKER